MFVCLAVTLWVFSRFSSSTVQKKLAILCVCVCVYMHVHDWWLLIDKINKSFMGLHRYSCLLPSNTLQLPLALIRYN